VVPLNSVRGKKTGSWSMVQWYNWHNGLSGTGYAVAIFALSHFIADAGGGKLFLRSFCLVVQRSMRTRTTFPLIYVWFIETTNIPLPRFERTLTGVAAKMPQ